MATDLADPIESLTPREREVIRLIAAGCTNAMIAERLGVTFTTAKWHVSEVLSRLGVSSREEAAERWRAHHTPRARVSRALHALVALPLLKIAAGASAASVVATGAGIAIVAVAQTVPADDDATVALRQVATETATPSATPEAAFVPPVGCPEGYVYPPPPGSLCQPSNHPSLAPLDKGGCDFSGAAIPQFTQFDHGEFAGCNLSNSTWDGAFMNDSRFDGANMEGIHIEGGTYAATTFVGANLRGATITSAQFHLADFSGADFTGASLTNVGLNETVWAGAICPNGSTAEANGGTCIGTPGVTTRES